MFLNLCCRITNSWFYKNAMTIYISSAVYFLCHCADRNHKIKTLLVDDFFSKVLEIHNKIEKTPTSSVESRQSSHSDYGSSRGGPISASHQLYASPQSIVHRTNSDTAEGLGSNEKTLLKELCNVSYVLS